MSAPKILYIEDDPGSRALVRRILEQAGYVVREAVDGLSGIEAALREHPALILLDIGLPGVDGYTVAAALNAFPNLTRVPIIALTAYAQPDDRERTLVAGCDGYIAKPIDVDRFPAEIAEFLHGKRERADARREGTYLRDLNQRLVYRLMNKVDEIRRLTDHVLDRARRLEEIHDAMQDLTSELGVLPLLERLLPKVVRALNAAELTVELSDPAGLRFTASAGPRPADAERLNDVEWKYPLVARDRPLGFLLAHYARGAGFSEEDEHLFKIVATQVGIAVENARLYETERRAHAEAEAGRTREAFLAEASAALAGSLDFESTLHEVARMAVPAIADVCLVDLVEDDGTIRRALVSERGGDGEAQIAVLQQPPVDAASLGHAMEVIRTAKSSATPEMTVAPLVARGRLLGAATFWMTTSDRRYSPADVALAEALTARAALALDNARLYSDVQDADRRKDLFLATLAHELRTPLAPIMNAIAIIRHYEPDEPVVHRAREIVERQVRHQARILDELFDLARIGRGKISLERTAVDVERLVIDALDVVRPLLEERSQALSVALPGSGIVVHGDATRLAQVLANLLSNAVKYTPTSGEVIISAAREGDRAVVRVRDTGVGIAPELLPHVFDPFFQGSVSAVGRRPGGLGVGLALVRRLVELHGGTVEARSEGAGRGTEFIVRLPVVDAPDALAAAPEASPAPPSRHILVVDDDLDTLEALRVMLQLDGHRVEIADSGLRAIDVATEHRPDIVLIDIGLPDIDGYEVARRLRAVLGRAVRLVALSGYGQYDDHERAHEAGCDRHLLKPVEPEELRRLLAVWSRRVG